MKITKLFKSSLTSLGLIIFTVFGAHAQRVISVTEAVELAVNNNLQVRSAQFQYSLSEQDLRQSRFDFYPTVSSNLSGSKNWGLFFNTDVGELTTESANNLSGSVSAQAALFQGFRRLHQVAANKHQLQADASNLDRIKNDLTLEVVTKYLEALVNQDLWTASLQQVALAKEQLNVAEINFEVGANTLADLSQAKSQVATDELNEISTLNAFNLAILELKQLMEMDPMVEIALERPELPEVEHELSKHAANELFAEALRVYPNLRVAAEQINVAEKNIDIARSAYYPSINIGGNLGTNYSSAIPDFELGVSTMAFERQLRRNFSQAVFFNISIPIFNNLSTRINVSRAKINYQNALNNERLERNNLNKIIHQAVLDLRSAESRLRSTEAAFEASKDAFFVIKERFDEGLANSIELTTSQTTMNRAEFEHIQAKYDLIFRSRVIDFYLGNDITF